MDACRSLRSLAIHWRPALRLREGGPYQAADHPRSCLPERLGPAVARAGHTRRDKAEPRGKGRGPPRHDRPWHDRPWHDRPWHDRPWHLDADPDRPSAAAGRGMKACSKLRPRAARQGRASERSGTVSWPAPFGRDAQYGVSARSPSPGRSTGRRRRGHRLRSEARPVSYGTPGADRGYRTSTDGCRHMRGRRRRNADRQPDERDPSQAW